MKKYSLTEDHRKQLPTWRNKWITNAMSTKPMDEEEKDICHKAVKELYQAANLVPPPDNRIVFVPSPFVGHFAASFAAWKWWRKNNKFLANDVIDDATNAATYDATDAATYDATDAATRAATQAATYDATHDATNAAIHDATNAATNNATYDAIRDATNNATYDATYDAIRDATYDAIRDATNDATRATTRDATRATTRDATYAAIRDATYAAIRDATDTAILSKWYTFDKKTIIKLAKDIFSNEYYQALVCATKSWNFRNGGNQWSSWCSFISFFRYIAKLDIDYTKWDCYEQLALHSGPRYMHKEFCIICDRPQKLTVDEQNRPHCEDGPFCQWRDGTALYAWHGVRVPGWIIVNPERITIDLIKNEQNQEIRRVMIEKMGWEKYLQDSHANIVNSDQCGELLEYQSDELLSDNTIKLVRVEDPSTLRKYVLRVSPDVKTAHEAVASTYNLDVNKYHPSQRDGHGFGEEDYRPVQGDLLFNKVEELPGNAEKLDSLILAVGISTGHSHRVKAGGIVYNIFSTNEKYIVVDDEATIVHEEHGTTKLSKGIWQVIRQREYTPAGWKQVED